MQTIVSNSLELEHAPKPNKQTTRLGLGWILGAIAVGAITAVIGTVMHLNSWWTGSFGLPWGVALALLIAGLGQYWTGLMSANMLAPGITGIAQYLTLAAMTGLLQGDQFSVPLNAQTWEFVPHLVIATLIWHGGIIVLTICMVVLTSRKLRRTANQLAAAQPYPELHSSAGLGDNR